MVKKFLARVWSQDDRVIGTAFLVTDKHLLTCAHVVNFVFGNELKIDKPRDRFYVDFPGITNSKVAVRIYTDFWYPVSGDYCVVSNERKSDIAVLEVMDKVPPGCEKGILFKTDPSHNLRGQSFYAHGFPIDAHSEERITKGYIDGVLACNQWLQVSAKQEMVGHTIQPGFSGGPVFSDTVDSIIGMIVGYDNKEGKREGFIIPTHILLEAWPELEQLGRFHNKSHLSNIIVSPFEVAALIDLLSDIDISEDQVYASFRKCVPDSRLFDRHEKKLLYDCLKFLAEKEHSSSDKAPLLEFLEYCKSIIEKQASQDLLEKIEAWKREVANRLNIDLEKFCAHIRKNKQPIKKISPGVLLKIAPKIEPKNPMSKDTFILSSWAYDYKNKPQQVDLSLYFPDEKYNREQLEDVLPKILEKIISLGGVAIESTFEVIIPFQLFDYNINQIELQTGPSLKIQLGKRFPVVARSWDRIYCHEDYGSVRQNWFDKWKNFPCVPHRIKVEHLHCLFCEDETVCCEETFFHLEANIWAFLALFPLPTNTKRIQEIFGTALAAGLPFVFWSSKKDLDYDALHKEIETLLCAHSCKNWPERLKVKRKTSSSSWSDIMMLWDNPERLPPDIDYPPLMAPEE